MATNYIWDFATDSYLMEKDDSGVTVAVYTSEPVQYGRLISQRRGSATSYYHFDAQGSTRQLTDYTGNVTDEYTYSAFGETAASSGTTINPFRYKGALGYYVNPETESSYVRARVYRASQGRWVSCDPIGLSGRVNLYAYVSNSPIRFVDPLGLFSLPNPGDFACGLYWEHYTDVLKNIYGWAASFAHCYSHCKIAQNCGKNAKDVSTTIGIYTETYQTAICLYLISQIGRCLACRTGVCRSASQASDFKDNQTGFDLGLKNPTGNCESMCKMELGFKDKHDKKAKEGPLTDRPFGPLCQKPW